MKFSITSLQYVLSREFNLVDVGQFGSVLYISQVERYYFLRKYSLLEQKLYVMEYKISQHHTEIERHIWIIFRTVIFY
jgi:hypothetical protein